MYMTNGGAALSSVLPLGLDRTSPYHASLACSMSVSFSLPAASFWTYCFIFALVVSLKPASSVIKLLLESEPA